MADSEIAMSRTTPRTRENLRVALAGCPADMPVKVGTGFDLPVATVGDLRALEELPYPFEVLIPFRLFPDSFVTVSRHDSQY